MGKGKYEFFEGQSLSKIWWEEGEAVVGNKGMVSIKISMECGQMAAVAWAVAIYEDGRCCKHNMALVSGCELALKGSQHD